MNKTEQQARLLCAAEGRVIDRWEMYVHQAEGLAKAGLVILPIEVDRKMYDAYVMALPPVINGNQQKCSRREKCKLRYKAMLAAAEE